MNLVHKVYLTMLTIFIYRLSVEQIWKAFYDNQSVTICQFSTEQNEIFRINIENYRNDYHNAQLTHSLLILKIPYFPKFSDKQVWTGQDQSAPKGAVLTIPQELTRKKF